jgi:hypothetical protein
MAQTGFTPIVTYNTATATTVPSAANLAQGELAVNVTDKKLYTKDGGGNVVLLASSGGDVTGPATSTNLAIPTFSGTGGKTLLDNSGATISAGVITATGFTGAHNGSLGATTPSTAVVTSINMMAITAPATSSTLAVADGKTLTANKTLTLDGTDSTTMTFPTTSATIARTDAAQSFTGLQTFLTNAYLTKTGTAGATQLSIGNATDASGAVIQYIGSTFATTTRRNALEFYMTGASTQQIFYTNAIERARIDNAGTFYIETGTLWQYAPAPATKAAVATLTAAEVSTGVLTTTGTTYTVTLPTGTEIDTAYASVPVANIGFDWVVINTASGTITIAVGASGMTSVGSLTIATGVSARFRLRRTAANTYVLYRLG